MPRFWGVFCAVALHLGFILFGGLFFAREDEDQGTLQTIDLLSETDLEDEKDEKKPEDERPADAEEELRTEEEEPPDAAEILRELDRPESFDAPALDAASLSAIELALSGQAGDGDFADVLSFASGGRIGGTGTAGAFGGALESAFDMSETDQQPRAVFQASALYPAEMRGKKVEGVVNLLFVVDAAGKVVDPKVQKSTHPAFEKPALDAVRRWKFEPAVRDGRRVSCKVSVPIRFKPGV